MLYGLKEKKVLLHKLLYEDTSKLTMKSQDSTIAHAHACHYPISPLSDPVHLCCVRYKKLPTEWVLCKVTFCKGLCKVIYIVIKEKYAMYSLDHEQATYLIRPN